MQQEPQPKPKRITRESVIEECDDWVEAVMTPVWQLLDEQCDGTTCITTPNGLACEVTVRFTPGGSA